MPRDSFDRFNYNEKVLIPNLYSLTYHVEIDVTGGGASSEEKFIDLAAHYDGFAVHYIQNVTNTNLSWIVVSDGSGRMAATPDRRLHR